VLEYVVGRRSNAVFLRLKQLLEPGGIATFDTGRMGAYERQITVEKHEIRRETQIREDDI
jgi:hypothetical protein